MTQIVLTTDIFSLVGLSLIHLVAGIIVGMRFRFGALLPLFAIVAVESLLGDFRFGLAPWYALLAAGLVIVQVGYALSSRFSPFRHASGAVRSMRASTPE